jgi:hypothetical protein
MSEPDPAVQLRRYWRMAAVTIFLFFFGSVVGIAWSVLSLKNDGVKLVSNETRNTYQSSGPVFPPSGNPDFPKVTVIREAVPVSITSPAVITAGVSVLTLIVTAIGATSTILLGWRSERRQSDEFKLKIQQLELQLAETKATAGAKHLDTAV